MFYGKIMLFGEYSVIFQSMALSVPYPHYRGFFRFPGDDVPAVNEFARTSNLQLLEFVSYLREWTSRQETLASLDTGRFEADVRKGLYFDSTILQGYGVGSSGALCAAVYHRYAIQGIPADRVVSQEDIRYLKSLFSGMESFFHGNSSGLDPLICYLRKPLLLDEDKRIRMVEIPEEPFGKQGALFLVDTGKPGRTEPLVNLFHEKTNVTSYHDFIVHQFIPVVHACITSLLETKPEEFFLHIQRLSAMQLSHFHEMIPKGFHRIFETGLNSGDYFMKLCGSGGGGFLLGVTPDFRQAEKSLRSFGLSPLRVF